MRVACKVVLVAGTAGNKAGGFLPRAARDGTRTRRYAFQLTFICCYSYNPAMKRIFIVITIVFLAVSAAASAIPPPQGYVSDFAGIMDGESVQQIAQVLQSIESSTGSEISVVTQNSLDIYGSIEEMALAYLTEWKVGKKGSDNGLILMIVNDKDTGYHAYRFETGYGLEGDLPDGLLGQIGREELVPWFRTGNYGTGVLSAMIRIGKILGANLNIAPPKRGGQQAKGIGGLVLLIIFIFFIIGSRGGRGGGSGLLWLLLLGSMGGRRGGFGGGGGFGGFGGGGGGFGGFGGGGGGGGGGATGSW